MALEPIPEDKPPTWLELCAELAKTMEHARLSRERARELKHESRNLRLAGQLRRGEKTRV